jgi:hypothetical protein
VNLAADGYNPAAWDAIPIQEEGIYPLCFTICSTVINTSLKRVCTAGTRLSEEGDTAEAASGYLISFPVPDGPVDTLNAKIENIALKVNDICMSPFEGHGIGALC